MVGPCSLRSVALVAITLALGAFGCSENPVGRKCFIGEAPELGQNVVTSPALECPSRTCLYMQSQADTKPSLCTAECDGDDDCDKVPESPCENGFTCAIPTVTGPFCCRKMCICRDYIVIPDGGVPEPEACNPDLEPNTCINLPGRG
jgi:hypothetical protein